MQKMTPAERAICAFNLGQPDEVPTFELEFQLSEEFFGYPLDDPAFADFSKLTRSDMERAAIRLADRYARVYGDKTAYDIGGAALSGNPELDSKPGLDYAVIPVYSPGWRDLSSPVTIAFRKRLREHFGHTRLFGGHAGGTFGIPDGTRMYDFVYRLADEPRQMLFEAQMRARVAVDFNHRQFEAGLDVGLMCSDYCYNSGPFLSPAMFDTFVTPFLAEICDAGRKDGMYMVKHTDGNIMPILPSIVQCRPHALQSVDPMAGVDIREVKRLYGDKIALIGNVNCAALQSGTEQEVIESAEYCLTYGKPGGGYIFSTSNVPFKGVPPERYQLILDIWKRMRKY